MAASPIDPDHPPLDFRPFGLKDWPGAKWVEHFEGQIGDPVWSVWLGHATGTQLVFVKTAPKARWDRVMSGERHGTWAVRGAGAVQFAVGEVRTLVDSARPDLTDEERERYNRGIVSFAVAQGSNWASWESAAWQLDGRDVRARVYRFADAWTGLTVEDAERYVGVAAHRLVEGAVELTTTTLDHYGWNPLRLPTPAQAGRPDTGPILRRSSVHPDHLRVLDYGQA